MGWGTGNLGGGSGGLNFKIVGYATEAELLADTPKENTIGIITTNKITGWMFSAMEPESPAEGMVWISTGTSSTIEFNALKKNGIQVYPLSAKQYISGAWADVTAVSYQGREWHEWYVWDGVLYNSGVDYIEHTGGWSSVSGYDVTMDSSQMSVAQGVVFTNLSINLSSYSTLKFMIANDGNWVDAEIGLGTTRGTFDASTTVPKGTKTFTEYSVDITSMNDEYYIGFQGGETDAQHTHVSKVWVVK